MTPDLVAFASRLADASGPIIRSYFRQSFTVDIKSDASPVTRADRESEAAIRALIEAQRPDDGFVGEETGRKIGTSGLVWVIDPIDGTKAFVCGKPIFGTLIALLEGDTPVLGVIDQPVSGERWIGARGHTSTLNGEPIATWQIGDIAHARLATTSPRLFSTGDAGAFEALSAASAITSYGGDCYNYALLATGTVDIVAETQLKLYDYAALIPVILGAGGVVSDWDGNPVGTSPDGSVLAAATPALHSAALAILRQSR